MRRFQIPWISGSRSNKEQEDPPGETPSGDRQPPRPEERATSALPGPMVRGSSPGHPAFVDQFSWEGAGAATNPATAPRDGVGRHGDDGAGLLSGEGHEQEQDGVTGQSPTATASGSRGPGRPDEESSCTTAGFAGLPPGVEATPDQSEDGHDQSVTGLTARVAQLERQVAVLLALTAPLLQQGLHTGQHSAFSTPIPNSMMYRLQLAGGSLSGSGRSSFTELPAIMAAAGQVPPPLDPPETVAMAATRVVMHQIVTPADVDPHGICPGGQVLSWIDIAAGLAAKTVARGPVVTASVDNVQFLRPCRLGSTAIIAAMVNRVFSSSMEVGVRVEDEDACTGERYHCCSAYLTFVSVLAKPSARWPAPRRLPRLIPSTPYLQEIWESADRRRRDRLERRQRLASQPEMAVPRLQPITHREGSPTLAPAIQVQSDAGRRGKRVVAPSMTLSHMTQLIMPQCANSLSICFGGQVMKWMEQCAYIAASRVNRGGHHLLTGSMDSIVFTQPTRVGDIMYITAQVTAIFGSSMEVMISVCGETPHIGEVFHCGDAYATVVSVTKDGTPVEVPFELQPVTEAERRQCAGAAQRREERLAMREALLEHQDRRRSLDGTMSWRGPPSPEASACRATFDQLST